MSQTTFEYTFLVRTRSCAQHFGIGYLSNATAAEAKVVVREPTGYLYGENKRGIVSLVVGYRTRIASH